LKILKYIEKKAMLRFELIDETGKAPSKGSKYSAGYDLYSAEKITIPANSRKLVSTKVKMEIPEDLYGKIASRSSMAVKGVDVCAGIIDSDYRGEVKVCLANSTGTDYVIELHDRIAQIIFEKYHNLELQQVPNLSSTDRGAGGFGSTGK